MEIRPKRNYEHAQVVEHILNMSEDEKEKLYFTIVLLILACIYEFLIANMP